MSSLGQFIRYALVGLASNAVLFVVYIFLTQIGMGPKLAMTLLYCLGVLQTFILNKKWSFKFRGSTQPALYRYVILYILGYIIQFFVLLVLVDMVGLSHQWVMCILILVMAAVFFFAQKFWVFVRIFDDNNIHHLTKQE